MRNEVPEIDVQDSVQMMKYLFNGLQLSDSEVIERVHQMLEAGYSSLQIEDHLGISELAVRLAVLARR